MTYTSAVLMTLAAFFAVGMELVMTPVNATDAIKTTYIAPTAAAGLTAKNQDYLIGIISFAVVAVATVMAVTSMMNINYDSDTLLMVEVPDEMAHEE